MQPFFDHEREATLKRVMFHEGILDGLQQDERENIIDLIVLGQSKERVTLIETADGRRFVKVNPRD